MAYRNYGKVEICGVNTAKLKTLTEEEKEGLLRRAKNGDARAREELIGGNLRLVLSVVRRFAGRTESMDDLFQIGCIGLIKAIDRFDVDAGVRLSTYAVPMIIGEVRRYLRDDNTIRVSRSLRDLAYKALRRREELAREHGTEPDLGEIAADIGAREEEVARALEAITEPMSLYEPVFHDGTDTVALMEMIGDPGDGDDRWLEKLAIREAMKKLTARERHILVRRFYEGKTQMEIASEIGISQAQVSRLEKGALERIKKDL